MNKKIDGFQHAGDVKKDDLFKVMNDPENIPLLTIWLDKSGGIGFGFSTVLADMPMEREEMANILAPVVVQLMKKRSRQEHDQVDEYKKPVKEEVKEKEDYGKN